MTTKPEPNTRAGEALPNDWFDPIDRFLIDLSECKDFDEPAADGGITVGMVFQQQAKWMRTLLARRDAQITKLQADGDKLAGAAQQVLEMVGRNNIRVYASDPQIVGLTQAITEWKD